MPVAGEELIFGADDQVAETVHGVPAVGYHISILAADDQAEVGVRYPCRVVRGQSRAQQSRNVGRSRLAQMTGEHGKFVHDEGVVDPEGRRKDTVAGEAVRPGGRNAADRPKYDRAHDPCLRG